MEWPKKLLQLKSACFSFCDEQKAQVPALESQERTNKRVDHLVLGEGEELVNYGSNVTLVVLEQVAVEIKVEETHAVERLELSSILLSGLDASGGGISRSGGDNSGSGSRGSDLRSGLLDGNNVNPDASTKGGARGTMHAPVRDVTTSLLGGLHLHGDGDGRARRDLTRNINKLNGAQALTSVRLESEAATKGPSGGARVRQTPDLGKVLTSNNLRSIRDGNVAQEGHLELLRGDELRGRNDGILVGSLDDLRLGRLSRKDGRRNEGNVLNRRRNGLDSRRIDIGGRRNGRNSGGDRDGRRNGSRNGVLAIVPAVMVRTTVPAMSAVGASGIHSKGVILIEMDTSIAARVAQVEIRASIALVHITRDGRVVATVADVANTASQVRALLLLRSRRIRRSSSRLTHLRRQ